MTASYTNRGLILMVTGEELDVWGNKLNTTDITATDAILASTLSIPLASSNVNISQANSQNLAFVLSGTLTTAITISLPLTYNSATVAMGGFFIFDNQTTGSFSVTVKTVASGSTGVVVPQGSRAILYSNGTNVYYANDGSYAFIRTYAGNPNGLVSGSAGDPTTGAPASMIWDTTNHLLWMCTGGTVWVNDNISSGGIVGVIPIAQGGTGNTTALAARGSSGLNIDQATSTSFNADSTIAATTRTVLSSATAMTGNHILTIPAANTVNAGQMLEVLDISGVVGTYTLTLQRAASDVINGATTVVISQQYAGYTLVSDGSAKWSAESILPNAGAYTASGGITLTGTNFTLDTNNVLGVGASVYCAILSGAGVTVASGATTAGSNLVCLGVGAGGVLENNGASLSGVWRNVSGATVSSAFPISTGAGGMFIRVS